MRILIIEDEAPLREQIAARLRDEGQVVDVAENGTDGQHIGLEYPIDVAIVDVGLPDFPGTKVVEAWRTADKRFPVLILTARDRWQDKVEGLESGADDYVTKPFHMEELLARLRALVRRSAGWSSQTLRAGPISVDPRAQSVTVHDQVIEVTAYEYRVLEYLLLHAGKVVSKSELAEHVYEEDMERDSNVLEVLVGRLRKKLDPNRELRPIETLRGRGYRCRLPEPVT